MAQKISGEMKKMAVPAMQDIPAGEMSEDAIVSFRGAFDFLSNYAPAPVEMYGITFPTVEHAFAAAKIDPGDARRSRAEAVAEMQDIAAAPTPGAAKRLGRRTLLRADWDTVKFTLVRELVARKFRADPALAARLIATGERMLVEGNTWGDRIWGMVRDGDTWTGRNALGLILMDVRAELAAAARPAKAPAAGPGRDIDPEDPATIPPGVDRILMITTVLDDSDGDGPREVVDRAWDARTLQAVVMDDTHPRALGASRADCGLWVLDTPRRAAT